VSGRVAHVELRIRARSRAGEPSIVLVITEVLRSISASALEGRERDTVRLTWEERRWTRKRMTTTGGRDIALALPTGSVLQPGSVLALERDWYLVVEGRPEPVLAIAPGSPADSIAIAFAVGNRHFPLAVRGDLLLVPDDSAMEQLLERLGASWERRVMQFEPIGVEHRHDNGARPSDSRTRAAPSHHHD
jgi:urease accessory protein